MYFSRIGGYERRYARHNHSAKPRCLLLQMRSVMAIGCRGGYEIMIEELGIPDLDLIKQAQQGAARCLPAPTVRSSRTMWYPWPEAAVLILTNQEGETL